MFKKYVRSDITRGRPLRVCKLLGQSAIYAARGTFLRAAAMQARTRHDKAVRPSVCISVTRVYCDTTNESSADILIPHKRSIILVF